MSLIRSKHAPASPRIAELIGEGKPITAPLKFPAPLTDFKEGGSFSVHIAPPLGNVLVQGSAGFIANALKGYQADVIFLGIAGLATKTQDYQDSYFKETVTTVGATRIIPVHWDNFTLPLSEPLQPQISLMGKFDSEMSFMIKKVEADKKLNLYMMQGMTTKKLFTE